MPPSLHLVPAEPAPDPAARNVGETPMQQVFREHAGFVATVVYRLVGRDDEVDDIVQDVFVVAIRGLGKLRDAAAVRPWLASVAVRVTRRRLRMRKLRRFCGLEDAPEYETLQAPGATPEESALLARIYEVLDRLPVDQRLAWCLRYVHGYRLGFVAEACGCSLATAKRRIAAAHAVLESLVSDG
jgi:RNA polymerase sigma-70 factor (ECF subfamily)